MLPTWHVLKSSVTPARYTITPDNPTYPTIPSKVSQTHCTYKQTNDGIFFRFFFRWACGAKMAVRRSPVSDPVGAPHPDSHGCSIAMSLEELVQQLERSDLRPERKVKEVRSLLRAAAPFLTVAREAEPAHQAPATAPPTTKRKKTRPNPKRRRKAQQARTAATAAGGAAAIDVAEAPRRDGILEPVTEEGHPPQNRSPRPAVEDLRLSEAGTPPTATTRASPRRGLDYGAARDNGDEDAAGDAPSTPPQQQRKRPSPSPAASPSSEATKRGRQSPRDNPSSPV